MARSDRSTREQAVAPGVQTRADMASGSASIDLHRDFTGFTPAAPPTGLYASLERAAARRARDRLAGLLAEHDVELDGARPWDPIIRDERVFVRALRAGTLGLGEAYVAGEWECAALDELIARCARAGLDERLGTTWHALSGAVVGRVLNRQTPRAAIANGRAHYDRGDDLYAAMLGPTMVYSCGYWRDADSLDAAQRAKLELACAKLDLRPGMRLLDVGCGYGELARHAAAEHGVEVVAITVSRHQAEHARRRCEGLPVDVREIDYRTLRGRFDRIVSVGMFEHVGHKNYERFFAHLRGLLGDDGLFLLHTIGVARESHSFDPWLDRYIFPGALLPAATQIARATDGKFVIEDWHNFGVDYDRTLMAWHANFERAWPGLAHYGEPFRRMWRYYLLSCAGFFRARRNQLWQVVLSPRGVPGGYRRPAL